MANTYIFSVGFFWFFGVLEVLWNVQKTKSNRQIDEVEDLSEQFIQMFEEPAMFFLLCCSIFLMITGIFGELHFLNWMHNILRRVILW